MIWLKRKKMHYKFRNIHKYCIQNSLSGSLDIGIFVLYS